jgi:hypothetical protein
MGGLNEKCGARYGYWGVELTGPMLKLEQAGYELVFTTPKGQRPIALPPSYDTKYCDPPLGVCVTTESDAKEVMAIKDDPRLDKPINLSEWFPERPYFTRTILQNGRDISAPARQAEISQYGPAPRRRQRSHPGHGQQSKGT